MFAFFRKMIKRFIKGERRIRMSKKEVIIDTDPGIDDAVALGIALFSEGLEVKLIPTEAGNFSCGNDVSNDQKE